MRWNVSLLQANNCLIVGIRIINMLLSSWESRNQVILVSMPCSYIMLFWHYLWHNMYFYLLNGIYILFILLPRCSISDYGNGVGQDPYSSFPHSLQSICCIILLSLDCLWAQTTTQLEHLKSVCMWIKLIIFNIKKPYGQKLLLDFS